MHERPERPPVSVVVPFAGDAAAASRMLDALARLDLLPDDEIVVADNSGRRAVPRASGVTVVDAPLLRSSYYARNVGAEATGNDWLVFLDADCRPSPGLLDAYFAPLVGDDVGAVAGDVLGAPEQGALAARYARSRRHLRQENLVMDSPYRPMVVTANLLVRRSAWAGIGGFHEGILSGGDSDFAWRLQDAGWSIEFHPDATVEHLHRETLRDLARQAMRIGAGWAWATRRHPGLRGPNLARRLGRCVVGVAVWTVTGRFERAAFKAVDALWVTAEGVGFLRANAAQSAPPPTRAGPGRLELVVVMEDFPALTETFVRGEIRALEQGGHRVRVEAAGRARRPSRGGARGLRVDYWEDDGIARKLAALAWLLVKAPLGCLRDLVDRRRWRAQEEIWPLRSLAPAARRLAKGGQEHLHVHFAAGAALNAMRLGRLLNVPYSVTVHAYDLFQHPRNLPEKIEHAAFATSVCAYTVGRLRAAISPAAAARVHEVGMGVDGERFRRRRAYPGGRQVVGVGRLVEKKGFRHLIDAAAQLESTAPLDRVTLIGDGPLAGALRDQAQQLGIHSKVMLEGSREHDEVRRLLEEADLLVMPSITASDGDQDSLPVVVEEALALEVPVVASDLGGLPEVIQPEWGALVAPGDPVELAATIERVLALPPDRRMEMGRRGRRFILEHRDAAREAARLAVLVASARPARRAAPRAPAPCARA